MWISWLKAPQGLFGNVCTLQSGIMMSSPTERREERFPNRQASSLVALKLPFSAASTRFQRQEAVGFHQHSAVHQKRLQKITKNKLAKTRKKNEKLGRSLKCEFRLGKVWTKDRSSFWHRWPMNRIPKDYLFRAKFRGTEIAMDFAR